MNTAHDRFIYEGRHLREWLLQLVEEESDRRNRAAKVITNQFSIPPGSISPSSCKKQWEEFSATCKAVLREHDFPAEEFAQKLVSLYIRLKEQIRPESAKRPPEEEPWWDEQWRKFKTMPEEAGLKWIFKQSYVEHSKRFPGRALQEPDETFSTSTTIRNIIGVFGLELLPAAEGLRLMLKQSPEMRLTAYGVICSMGRAGLEFYPEIIEGLKWHSLGQDHGFSFFLPLGRWLQTVSEKIPDIIIATASEDALVQENAIMALGYAGRELIRKFPEIEERALSRIQIGIPSERTAWAWTLGEIAERPQAIDRLLEATLPPDQPHSANAVESLGKLGREPDRVVPRLIAILHELKLRKSSLQSRQTYRQVTTALQHFGETARPAIRELVQMIWTAPEQYINEEEQVACRPEPDEFVIIALGRFGKEASEALPALLVMKDEMLRRAVKEGYAKGELAGYAEGCPDYLLEAIKMIGGKV